MSQVPTATSRTIGEFLEQSQIDATSAASSSMTLDQLLGGIIPVGQETLLKDSLRFIKKGYRFTPEMEGQIEKLCAYELVKDSLAIYQKEKPEAPANFK